MSAQDRARWDARHAAVPDVVPMPPDELRGRETLLPTGGRALDVACGRGAVAVWLARRGLAVDAVDVSGVAIAAAGALAVRYGVAGAVRRWVHDLDRGLPGGCVGPYDVVVCQRFRDPRLYPQLVARLAVDGLLVVTVLSEVGSPDGATSHGAAPDGAAPDGAPSGAGPGVGSGPYRAAPGELPAACVGLRVLAVREGDGEAGIVARR